MIKAKEKSRLADAEEQFIDSLLGFVRNELLGEHAVAVDADTYLFDQGVIDSLKILRLIAFVEHWTGATIPDSEIVMANFRSIRTIAERFVR